MYNHVRARGRLKVSGRGPQSASRRASNANMAHHGGLLKTVDVFAGIGGFALGLRDIAETVAFVEWDEESQKILQNGQAQIP